MSLILLLLFRFQTLPATGKSIHPVHPELVEGSGRTGLLIFTVVSISIGASLEARSRRSPTQASVYKAHAYPAHVYKKQEPQFTIMLDPAGDAKNTGRKLDDSFERGITLQFAEQLKQQLNITHPHINVILTRQPGEVIEYLQNAHFANRMNVDVYISFHFFQEERTKPQLSLYQVSFGNDFINISPTGLHFIPYNLIHLANKDTNRQWGKRIKDQLSQPAYTHLFDVQGIFKLPFKPLIGIKAPAIACEMSLKNKLDWQQFVAPMAHTIGSLITQKPTHIPVHIPIQTSPEPDTQINAGAAL